MTATVHFNMCILYLRHIPERTFIRKRISNRMHQKVSKNREILYLTLHKSFQQDEVTHFRASIQICILAFREVSRQCFKKNINLRY